MWAVDEASTQGSAKVGKLGEEVFLLFLCVRQKLSEVGWDRFVEERVSRLFEGGTWAFAYPVQVGVSCEAERAACIDKLGLGVLSVEGISRAVYVPAGDEFQDGRSTGIGLLMQFPGFLKQV